MSTSQTSRLTQWHLDAAGVGMIALLTGAAYFTILAPIARNRLAIGGVHSELTETQGRASKMRTVESAVNAELTPVESELESSPVRLEGANRLNRRLAHIMAVANDSGLVIHESRAADVMVGSRFDLVPIAVSGAGSYPNCGRFLARVYEDLPDIEVLGFDISGQPSNPDAVATFRFDLSWYAAPSMAAAPQGLAEGSR